MKKQTIICLLAILLAANVFSQKSLLPPPSLAFSQKLGEAPHIFATTTSDASLSEVLDATFDSITALTPIKGFNAAMMLPDGTFWKRSKGVARELPATELLTTDHLMAMGSISKTFVATTLLLLVEEGYLALDDSIGQYIGPYPNVAGCITIRQLLSHRSGLNDYLNENPASGEALGNDPAHIWTFDEILNGYVLAPNFSPGASWSYSNTNYVLAGVLIEALTGQAWYQVVRQKVIEPLELAHTFIYPFETPGGQPFAHVFADLQGNGTVIDVQGIGFPDSGIFSLAASAGCFITTPADLTIFMERIFGGHLLQASTLSEMQTDYIQNGSGLMYGLGAASFPAPQNLENWGHDGDLLYKSVALFFPTENMALAVQQNDDRSHAPENPNSVDYDNNDVFLALLIAYMNYMPVTGVDEISADNSMLLYPNPANEQVVVACKAGKSATSATLFNLQGQLMMSQKIENQNIVRIDLSSLPSGIYEVRIGEQSELLLKR
ncbi:MAG: serine hydrolase [Bacteroidetes bacterium]|nr:serine hydrolase [Bacteroidota bacterium]